MNLFRMLIENAQDLMVLLDAGGVARYVSPSAKHLLGHPRSVLVGTPLSDHVHPDDAPAVRAALDRLTATAGCTETFEAHLQRTDDNDGGPTWRTFEFASRSVWDDDGEVCVIVISARDVTERKNAEDALHQSRERNEALLHAVPDALVRVDRDGVYRDVKAPRSFDWFMNPDALIGTATHDVLPEALADRLTRCNRRALRTGQMQTVEYDVEAGDTRHYREARIMPYGKDEVVSILRDVTERKRSEETLRRSREQLRRLASRLQSVREEERTRIAREVHDVLGQQLTALRLDLARLKRSPAAGDDGAEATAAPIADMEARIDDTIQTVRRISAELRPGVLDDLGLPAALEWQADRFTQRSGLACSFTDGSGEHDLDADRATVLFRIFQEILTNVSRHAQASRVEAHLTDEDGILRLTVRDDGRGITADEISDPDALGLLGMKERVAPWNGDVHFDGDPSHGTTVTVHLPL